MFDRARAWDARVEIASCFMFRKARARGRCGEGQGDIENWVCIYVISVSGGVCGSEFVIAGEERQRGEEKQEERGRP